MSSADAVAIVLWIGATMYAIFGGADFGAGFWSLLAGRGEGGRRPRELIDWAIGPVWEANHVWLIFILVVLWTGFATAFEAIFSTLVHPAQPGRARHRAAWVRLRVPAHRAPRQGPDVGGGDLRVGVGADAVLHGHGRRRDRGRTRADRERRRRPGDELAESALVRDRRALHGHERLSGGRLPRQRRPACRCSRSGAVLRAPCARLRARYRCARGSRARHAASRRPVCVRRADRRRAAARHSLPRLRRRGARAAAPRRPARDATARGGRCRLGDLGLGRRTASLPPAADAHDLRCGLTRSRPDRSADRLRRSRSSSSSRRSGCCSRSLSAT